MTEEAVEYESIFTEENLLGLSPPPHRFWQLQQGAPPSWGHHRSAISYTISAWRTGLDVVLFVRNTRSIELTESGFYFTAQSHRPA